MLHDDDELIGVPVSAAPAAEQRHLPTPGKPDVYRITGAARSLSEDVSSRQIRYVISMAIRTICFVLAVVTGGWVRIVFFIGAVVLPYLAVVFANAGREQASVGPDLIAPPPRPQIAAGPDQEAWPPVR